MDDARTSGRALTRLVMLGVVLGLVTVAGLTVGTLVLLRGPQTPAYADDAVQQDVRAAAEKFAVSVNTYDVSDLDAYVERVSPLLTDALTEQFEASTANLLSQFETTGIVSKGTVKQVAVDSVDDDSAEVLASITVDTEPSDLQVGQPRLRWRISLVREDGVWLVDKFVNLTVEGPDDSTGEGAAGDQEDGS